MSCGRSCRSAPRPCTTKRNSAANCQDKFRSTCSTKPVGSPRKVPPRPFAKTVVTDPAVKCGPTLGSKSYEEEYAKHLEKQIYYLQLENEYRRNSQKLSCGTSPYKAPEEELDDKLKDANKQIVALKEQLNEKQNGLKLVAAHRDELQQKLSTINDVFLSQKTELMENMLQVKRDIERLKLERKKLDFDSEVKGNDILRYKDDILGYKNRIEIIEEETIALKEKYTQLNNYAADKEEELVQANKNLFEAREKLAKSDICIALQTSEELRKQLADALADTAALRARLEEEEQSKSTLEEQLQTVLTETAGFVAQTARMEAQINQIKARRGNLEQLNSDMVEELTRLQMSERQTALKLEACEKLMFEKEAAVAKLQQEVDQLVQRTHEMQNTCDAYLDDNKNVLEFTKLLEAELQELEKQKVTADTELEVSKKKVHEKDDLIAQLRNYTIELEKKLEELEAEKWRYKQEQVAKWNQMMQLTNQIQHVSKDVVDDIRGCRVTKSSTLLESLT